jgi:hypothetical protein
MQKITRKLEGIKLSNYKGENIELCFNNIIACCDQLDADGAFIPDLLMVIFQILKGTSDHHLMTWATSCYKVVGK